MGYILFLISVLIATFYYFRMARRFESFDSEITQDLQREMNSLILDFNQTANQNITLLEDRILEGKTLIQDLATQISYLKKIKDTLDAEVRELQKSLVLMKDEYKVVEQEQRTLVQQTYEQIAKDMKVIQNIQPEKISKPKKQKTNISEDHIDIDKETLFLSESHTDKIKQESLSLKVKTLKPNLPKANKNKVKPSVMTISPNDISNIKAKILEYYQQGWDQSKISNTLNINKGEVDLVIQLFRKSF